MALKKTIFVPFGADTEIKSATVEIFGEKVTLMNTNIVAGAQSA